MASTVPCNTSGAIPVLIDSDGGMDLGELPVGTVLKVVTGNNTYRVVIQPNGAALVSGHPIYCPVPTSVSSLGSSYIAGLIREGYLCRGMRLTFTCDGRRVATSPISSLQRLEER